MQLFSCLDDVTLYDIQSLGNKMCKNSKLSIAAMGKYKLRLEASLFPCVCIGDLSELPEFNEIETAFITKQSLTSKQRFSFFR